MTRTWNALRGLTLACISMLAFGSSAIRQAHAQPRLTGDMEWLDVSQEVCLQRAEGAVRGIGFDPLPGTWHSRGGTNPSMYAIVGCFPAEGRSLLSISVAGLPTAPTYDTMMRLLALMKGSTAPVPAPAQAGGACAAANQAVQASWNVATRTRPRAQEFPFCAAAPAQAIRIRLQGGVDNTGDRMVEVLLHDPSGALVLSRTSQSSGTGWEEWRVDLPSHGPYVLVVRDLDSADSGESPGNQGKVEILFE